MKQLVCEMCGSSELIKKDGVFVCQYCGCKYSVEEAKKMMIDGKVDVSGSTIKVDNEQKLKNLKELAERAKESNDSEKAAKYYEQILIEEPNNWKANFYSVYYAASNIKIAEMANAANRLSNNIEPVFKLIIAQEPKENYKMAYTEVMDKIFEFLLLIAQNLANYLNQIVSPAINLDSSKKFYTKHMGAATMMACNVVCKICEYFDEIDYDELNARLEGVKMGFYLGLADPVLYAEVASYITKSNKLLKLKKYWSEHADEKNKLEKEKKETINKQKEIMGKLENDPRYKEFNQIMKEIEETKKEKEKLLIFKFKEKKLLDEKIKELDEKSNEVLQPIKYLMDELIKLQGRVNEINEELTKDR